MTSSGLGSTGLGSSTVSQEVSEMIIAVAARKVNVVDTILFMKRLMLIYNEFNLHTQLNSDLIICFNLLFDIKYSSFAP